MAGDKRRDVGPGWHRPHPPRSKRHSGSWGTSTTDEDSKFWHRYPVIGTRPASLRRAASVPARNGGCSRLPMWRRGEDRLRRSGDRARRHGVPCCSSSRANVRRSGREERSKPKTRTFGQTRWSSAVMKWSGFELFQAPYISSPAVIAVVACSSGSSSATLRISPAGGDGRRTYKMTSVSKTITPGSPPIGPGCVAVAPISTRKPSTSGVLFPTRRRLPRAPVGVSSREAPDHRSRWPVPEHCDRSATAPHDDPVSPQLHPVEDLQNRRFSSATPIRRVIMTSMP